MNPHVKIIALNESFNINTSQNFHQTIKEVITNEIKIVLIDFQGVTFMDSSGLGALVLSFKTLQESGIKMVMCSINEQVRMLFELTGMDSVFTIIPNQEAFENLLVAAS
jgi:anti-anti-sigma factor